MKWEVDRVVLCLTVDEDDFMAVEIAERGLIEQPLCDLPKGLPDSVRAINYDCHFGAGFQVTFDGTPSDLDKYKTQAFIKRHIDNCRKQLIKRKDELTPQDLRHAEKWSLA